MHVGNTELVYTKDFWGGRSLEGLLVYSVVAGAALGETGCFWRLYHRVVGIHWPGQWAESGFALLAHQLWLRQPNQR